MRAASVLPPSSASIVPLTGSGGAEAPAFRGGVESSLSPSMNDQMDAVSADGTAACPFAHGVTPFR